jgi:hypothetical protein
MRTALKFLIGKLEWNRPFERIYVTKEASNLHYVQIGTGSNEQLIITRCKFLCDASLYLRYDFRKG